MKTSGPVIKDISHAPSSLYQGAGRGFKKDARARDLKLSLVDWARFGERGRARAQHGRSACNFSTWNDLLQYAGSPCTVSEWNGLTQSERQASIVSKWNGMAGAGAKLATSRRGMP